MGDYEPQYALRDYSAPQLDRLRERRSEQVRVAMSVLFA